jgi:hypothetical protein
MLFSAITGHGKPSVGCNIIESILEKLCYNNMKHCLKFLLGAVDLNTKLTKSKIEGI